MKRQFFFWLFITFFGSPGMASQWISVQSPTPASSQMEYAGGTLLSGVIRLNLQGFSVNDVQTESGKAVQISSPGAVPILEKGAPDLPQFATSVILPDHGTLAVKVVNARYTDYPNMDVAPSKGNLYRNVDPSTVPFTKASCYQQDVFWPAENFSLREPYLLRDFRGQTILLRPFIWNPVTKVLRVYTYLELQYSTNPSLQGINELNRTSYPVSVDKDYYYIYRNHFLNSPSIQYAPLSEEGKMLIICDQQWVSEMQPFVQWKTRRGVPVELVTVQSIGNSVNALQNYIQNYYNVHGLTFVLLVGDAPQIATPFLNGGASDPSYGYLLGNDSYAEVLVGRFSAQSAHDVTTQVERVIHYERDISAADTWLANGVVVGSNQGPGDDGEMDWEHEVNIRTDLVAFNYAQVDELYDGSHAGTTDAAGDPGPLDLFNLLQGGRGIVTYTGHGSTTACTTTGFSSSNVQNLTNVNELPFIWSVACVNGEFTASVPCLAETFLSTTYNDQPVGAIAAFMSSINQSWNPPMDGQDEMVDLLTNVYPAMHRRTFGGISVNGCLHMNDNYGPAGAEMTDTWHCFGDPTLQVRTSSANALTVIPPSVLTLGMTTATITASADSAMVSLVQNGQILATGIVVNGNCQLTFPVLTTMDSLYVTVTGFNLQTYQSVIPVIPTAGPYLSASAGAIADPAGNNNNACDFGESVSQEIVLTNFGSSGATAISVSITSADTNVTITSGSFTVPASSAFSVQSFPGILSYSIASNVPDMHLVHFQVVMADGSGNTWNSVFSQVIHAPELRIGLLTIDDASGGNNNGVLEPGETAVVKIKCSNAGHSNAVLVSGTLTSLNSGVFINNPAMTTVPVSVGSSVSAQFTVSLLSNISFGTVYDLTLSVVDGAYSALKSFPLTAGIVLETFESGSFSSFNWQDAGNMPWSIANTFPFEGVFSAVSGTINDNENSELLMNLNVPFQDSITFWYKVSSEASYDFLHFYMDNDLKQSWSGTIPWTYTGFAISAGQHTLRWKYSKDFTASSGSDCAWLDNIRFPAGSTITGMAQLHTVDGEMVVFPNPATDILTVIGEKGSGNSMLRVNDLAGRTVLSQSVKMFSGDTYLLDVQTLPAGVYILQLSNEGQLQSKLIQITR